MSKQRIDEMKKFIQLSEGIYPGRQRPDGERFINLAGPDGNAFFLLGFAEREGRRLGWDSSRIQQVQSEMKSGDYENLLTVFDREFGDYVDLYRGEDDDDDEDLEEGLADKVSGWFFKKGTEPLIAEIDKFGPVAAASRIMQKPEKTQRAMIQGAKHYIENVNAHPGLCKFVELMTIPEMDVYESSEEDAGEMFYVIVIDGSDRCVARLEKFGRSWHEECVFGDSPDGFGSKTYMGYLSPEDIISWLNRDYDTVAGPFENEYDAEIEMDRMAEEEGDADESWMYESVKLDNIVRSVLSEGAYEDYLRKTDPLGGFDDWDMDNPRGPRIEEPKTNLCPNCEGMGCDECEGEGEVFESVELMETAGFWMFGEALRGMIDNGTITVLQALLIYVSATVLPLGLFALLFDGEGFSRRVARIYKDFKDMRKLDENEIRRVAEIAENLYHKLPPGKKGHMTRLLARLNNAGIENKKTALSAKRELESYIEQNHSVNEMVGDKDLTTTFEDALEIAYEMAEADPETETTQHLKKALVKAGGNGKDLKAFYEWLDEQGVYTHPSLLETDDDDDDRIIDVGDDEDFEDYSLPHNWNDDNSLEDEYKRGLRFD